MGKRAAKRVRRTLTAAERERYRKAVAAEEAAKEETLAVARAVKRDADRKRS